MSLEWNEAVRVLTASGSKPEGQSQRHNENIYTFSVASTRVAVVHAKSGRTGFLAKG